MTVPIRKVMMRRRWIIRILAVIGILLLVAVGGFVIWAGTPAGVLLPEFADALESDSRVTVSSEPWLTFTPQEEPSAGFIFYPGGRVLPESYAPAMREIAEAGHLVVVPSMPLNLAVFSPYKASDVIAAYPQIETWVISGHSLGGSMAATFAHANPELIDGIVFWASYPQASDSLAELEIAAASVYGTLDGLLSVDTVEQSREYLPDDATFVRIQGGNHAQFGSYGQQSGDNDATISHEAQQAQAIEAVLDVLAAADD
jgi:dienelactone hydrolase